MLNALPPPGPADSNFVSASLQPQRQSTSASPMAVMKTVVLSQPAPSQPAPPHLRVSAPIAAPASTMKTIVLNNPIEDPPPKAPRQMPSGTSRKAIELKEKAIALLGRGIKVGLKVIAPVINEHVIRERMEPAQSSSSTAKTADLSIRRSVTPIRHVAATPSTSSKPAVSTNGRASPAAPAKPTAHLIAAAEKLQFEVIGNRAVIGRVLDPNSDAAIDIDLNPLRQSSDRVSRRHAEIVKRGDAFFVRDLGSLNGTFIVGRGRLGRDQLYQLKDGDQMMLGNAILEFRKA